MSLIEKFLVQVERDPEAAALIAPDGHVLAYHELARLSALRAQAWARAGIGAGDVVLVARGVGPGLYAALLALFRLGAVAMFPEPAAGLKGLAVAVEAARPRAIVAGPLARTLRPFVGALRGLPVLPEPNEGMVSGDGILTRLPEDAPALITFTSGSTGRPKGIVRSARFLLLQHALLEALRKTQPRHRDLISLPVFILSNLAEGAASVIPAGDLKRPASLSGLGLRQQLARERVARIIAPPAVCARIAEPGAELPGLEAIFTGGGPVFPNLLHALKAAAPAAAIHAVYGSTEAEPIAHLEYGEIGAKDWAAMAAGKGLLAGRPIPEIALEIRGGEIEVAGPHVNRGYLDPSDDVSAKTTRKGVLWHRTGDAGRQGRDGRLWLLGRTEAASVGLYPFAVETAALSWPGVAQAGLLAGAGGTRLFVSGAGLDLPDLTRRARALGDIALVPLRTVPMDRRHNSKVDYGRLRRLAERA